MTGELTCVGLDVAAVADEVEGGDDDQHREDHIAVDAECGLELCASGGQYQERGLEEHVVMAQRVRQMGNTHHSQAEHTCPGAAGSHHEQSDEADGHHDAVHHLLSGDDAGREVVEAHPVGGCQRERKSDVEEHRSVAPVGLNDRFSYVLE